MLIFFDQCGPMLKYRNGVLTISDLNPESERHWSMSRWEMLGVGWRCILAASQAPASLFARSIWRGHKPCLT